MAARFSCKRLILCLPRRQPLEPWLSAASTFIRALPGCDVELVAAPLHRLHDLNHDLVEQCIGRQADAIHLVPSPQRVVGFAADCTDSSTLLVTCAQDARLIPRRLRGSTLILPVDVQGHSVVALVDPARDAVDIVTTAVDFAQRLAAKRVVVCRIFFNEGALRVDEALDTALAHEREQLEIFMARVPAHDWSVSTRVSHAPDLTRAIARIAGEESASLVVSAERLRLPLPTLALAPMVARQRQVQHGGIAAFIDTVFGSAPLQA